MALTLGIVVGLDGCGKTSLIGLMKDVDPSITVKKVVESGESRSLQAGETLRRAQTHMAVWDAMKNDPQGKHHTLIYDRFPYPDDYIYQSGGGLTAEKWPLYQRTMAEFGARFILCLLSVWEKYIARQLFTGDIQTDSEDRVYGQKMRYSWFQRQHAGQEDILVFYKREDRQYWFTREDATRALQFIRKEGEFEFSSGLVSVRSGR